MNSDEPPSASIPRSPNAPSPETLAKWIEDLRDQAKPQPMYTPPLVTATYVLHYDCTVWLSAGHDFPVCTSDAVKNTANLWINDALFLEEFKIRKDKIQILFRARPDVSPVVFASRIKGRLQHTLRTMGYPLKFSRKVSFRCLGDNISAAVVGYLKKQVRKEGFVDPSFAANMEKFTVVRDDVNLAEPCKTVRGRYWYNLHLVLVVEGRVQLGRMKSLEILRDGCLRIAKSKGYQLKSVSVMLEHIHIALRGIPEQSPQDIALAFMNNLAWIMGRNRIWQNGYYVGTFSEYSLSNLPFQRHKVVGDV
jgi:REP element-mobilizing transposase RayT